VALSKPYISSIRVWSDTNPLAFNLSVDLSLLSCGYDIDFCTSKEGMGDFDFDIMCGASFYH
jgi:hypothetical protein